MNPEMTYDRRAPELLGALADADGLLADLLGRCGRDCVDLQVRKATTGAKTWVSLYVGMTTVLDVSLSAGHFRAWAHRTHRINGGFDDTWNEPMPLKVLASRRPEISGYLDRVIPTVAARHIAKEGRVHAGLSSGASDAYAVADREAAVGFRNNPVKDATCSPLADVIHSAVLNAHRDEPWWPDNSKPLKAMGTGLDVLAVDPAGRLLAIEAKPASALEGITWGPAQVRFYAELFAKWANETTDARSVIAGQTAQRVALGLGGNDFQVANGDPVVVPVLVVAEGRISPQAVPRARAIRDVIDALPAGGGVASVAPWRLDAEGHPIEKL